MSRKKLTEKQIEELLTSTPLFESEGEEFDCDSDEDWKLPLTEDSSDGSDQDSTVNEEETRETDNILCKYTSYVTNFYIFFYNKPLADLIAICHLFRLSCFTSIHCIVDLKIIIP